MALQDLGAGPLSMISLCAAAAASSGGLFPMSNRFDIYRSLYRSRLHVLVITIQKLATLVILKAEAT